MKIGFLLNITLLLCFVCSYILLWLIDGTLVRNLVLLFDGNSSLLDPEHYQRDQSNPDKKGSKPKTKQATTYPFKLVETTFDNSGQKQTHQQRFQQAKEIETNDNPYNAPHSNFVQNVYVAHHMVSPDEDEDL